MFSNQKICRNYIEAHNLVKLLVSGNQNTSYIITVIINTKSCYIKV